jgi:hypothetical protein
MSLSRHITDLSRDEYTDGIHHAPMIGSGLYVTDWWTLVGGDMTRHPWGQPAEGHLRGVALDAQALRTLLITKVGIDDKRGPGGEIQIGVSTPSWVRGTKTITLGTADGGEVTLSRADIADAVVAAIRSVAGWQTWSPQQQAAS